MLKQDDSINNLLNNANSTSKKKKHLEKPLSAGASPLVHPIFGMTTYEIRANPLFFWGGGVRDNG